MTLTLEQHADKGTKMPTENEALPETLTLVDIAGVLGINNLYRLSYAVKTYKIQPTRRAGSVRLFARDDLPRIRSAYERVTARVRY